MFSCTPKTLKTNHTHLLTLQAIVTDGNLDAVDDGIEFVIQRDKAVLDKYAHSFLFAFTSIFHDQPVCMNGVSNNMAR